jgi:hypothetical protein
MCPFAISSCLAAAAQAALCRLDRSLSLEECRSREHGGMYYLGAQACAASATAMPGELELAVDWHRRLGHLGYDMLAKLSRAGMLEGCSLTPASFVQASHPCVHFRRFRCCIVFTWTCASSPLGATSAP